MRERIFRESERENAVISCVWCRMIVCFDGFVNEKYKSRSLCLSVYKIRGSRESREWNVNSRNEEAKLRDKLRMMHNFFSVKWKIISNFHRSSSAKTDEKSGWRWKGFINTLALAHARVLPSTQRGGINLILLSSTVFLQSSFETQSWSEFPVNSASTFLHKLSSFYEEKSWIGWKFSGPRGKFLWVLCWVEQIFSNPLWVESSWNALQNEFLKMLSFIVIIPAPLRSSTLVKFSVFFIIIPMIATFLNFLSTNFTSFLLKS